MSYFPAFMGNELGLGSEKSSENRFAVHGICHVPHPSSFPMNAEKRHSFLNLKKNINAYPFLQQYYLYWIWEFMRTMQYNSGMDKLGRTFFPNLSQS